MEHKSNVLDVARYILEQRGSTTTMKLQKLVYYAQAWSLVWDEEPLFPEQIRAWANGPVVPKLFEAHQGKYRVEAKDLPGSSKRLTERQKDTINRVIEFYGDKTPQWLSDLTHAEAPWREARKGLRDGERGNRRITLVQMADYYGSL